MKAFPRDVIRAKTRFSSYHQFDLQTSCAFYKYVNDSTIFEICNQNRLCVIQDSANVVEQWSCNNDMRINTSKTKEWVLFPQRQNICRLHFYSIC